MTSDEIIRMAREAGLEKYHLPDSTMEYEFDRCVELFARAAYEAGAAAEREACAKHFERLSGTEWLAENVADEIRARSEK